MSGNDRPSRVHVFLALSAVAGWFIAAAAFFPFTVDDALIVARYAMNAQEHGEWVFNRGEGVMALTSPLHGLLMILLARLFSSDLMVWYKSLAILLTAGALLFCAVRFGPQQREALLLLGILPAPAIALWASAGLETPLLLALVTVLTTCYVDLEGGGRRAVLLIAGLSGLTVLTRYDAVLFVTPLLLASLFHVGASRALTSGSLLIAGAPLALWFGYAWTEYHAILPTSFYVKRPGLEGEVLLANMRYMLEHLVLCGAVLLGYYVVLRVLMSAHSARIIAAEARARWGLYAGLTAVLAYGTTMAATHMMFAFRHFVPYLPATGLALAHLLRRSGADGFDASGGRRPHGWLEAVVAIVLVLHGVHAWALSQRSLQGLGTNGEYTSIGASDYMDTFVPALRRGAKTVRQHWARQNETRFPRVWTFAAGVLPYEYADAYVFEELVSFRHRCTPDWKMSADYLHVFTRNGNLLRQLPHIGIETLALVSTEKIRFDGVDETIAVYYNPAPLDSRLPPRVDQPCLPE